MPLTFPVPQPPVCLLGVVFRVISMYTAVRRTHTAGKLAPSVIMKPSSPAKCPDPQTDKEELPASLEKLRQLIEDKIDILQLPSIEDQQDSRCEEDEGEGGLWRLAVVSRELSFHLQQLQTQTEQELSNIQTQLSQIEGCRQQLTGELSELQKRKEQTEEELRRSSCPHASAFTLCACRDLQAVFAERLLQSEGLVFQRNALSALCNLLTQDLQKYQEERQQLTRFAQRVLGKPHRSGGEETLRQSEDGMQGKNETVQENNMEPELDQNRYPDSPSEEGLSTPRAASSSESPKFHTYTNNEPGINGVSGRDEDGGRGSVGEKSPRLARWETTRLGLNHYRGSLESLASRDWDTGPDRVGFTDSPSRVFNSPYTSATSLEYNPSYRVSEFKGRLSPSTSELNLYSFNSRSTSPVGTPTFASSRPRFSAYDTLMRRRAEANSPVASTHYSMRSATLGAPNKRDYIEELTKELDTCQKRNQFLEAESVQMEKERSQIRLDIRNLLVSKEDLHRTNTQLTNELKRLREQMVEMEREKQAVVEECRSMEFEVKQAREMMVEANTQEYAFNYLQQSLQNKIQDAEENLEKQTQRAQDLSDKLWLAERQLEELEMEKGTKDKKTSELNATILRLETELGDALQNLTQVSTELSLQQKLRDDAHLRVEELEETLLDKDQELQRLQSLVSKLQGEVSGKLIDKERTLEEEIQLRERLQLMCKQAERTVEDLTMELQSTNQAKEDLAKQLKQTQEKMLDLESDLEELQESEHRWAAKHKRTIEQTELLQQKLIQQKELNEELEAEKASMERQLRELRLEVEDLHSSKVQEDVISKAEIRAKELENALRVEERSKASLSNTINKLERRISELTDQMDEETRIANEQKELMTQRIRSLKRQLNEVEEEASRKEAQYRHIQRELAEQRENTSRLERQLLEQHLQNKRKENLTIRQTLDNLRLDLDDEDEEENVPETNNVTKV
ncbi:myosin-13 isoform X3 [Oryzias latipes]|uniref:myosin-13 isoform X3 n=1 Tax=Oryzias latipes TaxID=8090 RepID=UPI0009DB5374|nr:myosin-13 isoform X3 [Oryzias latipes]